jgi:hypothetical protein
MIKVNKTIATPLSYGLLPATGENGYYYEYTIENEEGATQTYRESGDKEWAEGIAAEHQFEMPSEEITDEKTTVEEASEAPQTEESTAS